MIRYFINAGMLFFCIVFSFNAKAQFHYRARLDTVEESGFYRIQILPELSSYLKTDYSDIRIANEKNVWIPHIIKKEAALLKKENLSALLISKKDTVDGGKSEIVLKNILNKTINNLVLQLANTAVTRHASLSGSNNNKDWFVIDDDILLENTFSGIDYKQTSQIFFPESKYGYFKLVIDNQKNDPLNILAVFTSFTNIVHQQEYTQYNPAPFTLKKDSSNKISYVKILHSKAYHINSLYFNIDAPAFFERKATLCMPGNDSAITSFSPGEAITSFTISSTPFSLQNFSLVKSNCLYLVIYNKDNPPLQIQQVETGQTKTSLIAFLEKGHSYSLFFDDSLAAMPEYDLKKFENNIPESIKELKVNAIEKYINVAPAPSKSDEKNWLWPVLLGILALLLIFTRKLVKEMKQR